MIPAAYHIKAGANSAWDDPFVIGGITDATGYSAEIAIRTAYADSSILLLALTSSGGALTLSASASGLRITPLITATAMDTLRAAAITANVPYSTAQQGYTMYYSLKVTPPGGATLAKVYLRGTFTILDTTTS